MALDSCDECGTEEDILRECDECTEDIYRYCPSCIDTHVHEVYSCPDHGDFSTDYDSYESDYDYETPYEDS